MKAIFPKIIVILIILALVASITCPPAYAQEAEAFLAIRVLDPLGRPLEKIEVHLIRGSEVREFLTNSTGYAEFRHLTVGEYLARVKLDNITLAEKKVSIPEDKLVELTAQVGEVKLWVKNLDGGPVKGAMVSLRSVSGYEVKAESDKDGAVSFRLVPYSELESVGSYTLTVKLGDVEIYEEEVQVNEPSFSKNVTTPLLRLRLTIVDLEGNPVPRITVELSSKSYSAKRRSDNGTVVFENIPSSKLEDIGVYGIEARMRTEAGDMLIYVGNRSFTESLSLSLIADLARIRVKVLDEEGEPVSRVRVVLSNDLLANFTSRETDESGVATFERIPLSRGVVKAGTYIVRAYRAENLIGEVEKEILEHGETIELRVKRGAAAIRLLDFRGAPLTGYLISLIDSLTGERYNRTTDEGGEASFKIFYGSYELQVYDPRGSLIHSQHIRLTGEKLDLKLKEVNFPLKIVVSDSFGNPLTSGVAEIYLGDEKLLQRRLDGKPIILELPHPAELRIDVLSDEGDLIQRETIYANGPSTHVVRLDSYIQLGGLLRLEELAQAIGFGISALILALSIILLVRSFRGKG